MAFYVCPCGGPFSIWTGQPYRLAAQYPGICTLCRKEGKAADERRQAKPTRTLGNSSPRDGTGRHKGLKIPRPLKAV